jgi:hypothetical protein
LPGSFARGSFSQRISVTERNATEFECFRFTDLDFFYDLARRSDVRAGRRQDFLPGKEATP